MIDFEFGDVINCCGVPDIDHYIVFLGHGGMGDYLYTKLTSRIYKAFDKVSEFLDDCYQDYQQCGNKTCKYCKNFSRYFNKEIKDERVKKITGNMSLCDAVFLDQEKYELNLKSDSMIVLNCDPEIGQISTLKEWDKEGLIKGYFTLDASDMVKIIKTIDFAENISLKMLNFMHVAFNKKRALINQRKEKIDKGRLRRYQALKSVPTTSAKKQ